MKKYSLLLISGLLAANFAVTVYAAHFADYAAPDAEHNQEKEKMGVHKMTGIVDSIDYANGMLTLRKSGAPDMILHFPAASIKNLKNGDAITVDLGFSKK